MLNDSSVEKIRRESWDHSFHSFGTAYLFNKRAIKFAKRLNQLKVFGIVVPAFVGAMVTGYGLEFQYLKELIAAAIGISVAQFTVSILAVIYKWDDQLAYAYESSKDHNYLSLEFKSLGSIPLTDETELKKKFEILLTKLQAREEQDAKHDLTEKESRRGMRWALREYKRECVGCQQTPKDMRSTNCPVCGKFSWYQI